MKLNTLIFLTANAGDHGIHLQQTSILKLISVKYLLTEATGKMVNGLKLNQWKSKAYITSLKLAKRICICFTMKKLESLAINIPGIKRIRFFMTFGQSYLTHLKCLENVGMTSIEPIEYEGKQIVPLQFLKAVLPDPASLGPRTKGKTNIGCIFQGIKDGKDKTYYVYNVCDHEECYKEVGSQAISYTTGVPAMIGAMMLMTGTWNKKGVYNIEEFDPDPFMDALNKWGLPWKESFDPELVIYLKIKDGA